MRLSKRLAACNALLDVAGFRAVDEDATEGPYFADIGSRRTGPFP